MREEDGEEEDGQRLGLASPQVVTSFSEAMQNKQ